MRSRIIHFTDCRYAVIFITKFYIMNEIWIFYKLLRCKFIIFNTAFSKQVYLRISGYRQRDEYL